VTGYELHVRGPILGTGNIFLLHSVKMFSEDHTGSYKMGTANSSLGVKRPGRNADYSPPSSVEVNNGGATPPIPHASPWRNA
jgi:hypothetical protein